MTEESELHDIIKELQVENERLYKIIDEKIDDVGRLVMREKELEDERTEALVELDEALAVIPVLTAKLIEVEKERDALRGLIQ